MARCYGFLCVYVCLCACPAEASKWTEIGLKMTTAAIRTTPTTKEQRQSPDAKLLPRSPLPLSRRGWSNKYWGKYYLYHEGIRDQLKIVRSHLIKQQCTPVFDNSLFLPHSQLSNTYWTCPFLTGRIAIIFCLLGHSIFTWFLNVLA